MTSLPRRLLRSFLRKRGYRIEHLPDEEWRYLERLVDDSVPVPQDAAQRLRTDHPRLLEITQRYERYDVPASNHSRWSRETVRDWLTPSHFRGDSPYVWHYRERRSTTALKYFVYLADVARRDTLGLLQLLQEDGQFGCWSWQFPGYPRVSRDYLDSITEINFLERQLKLSARPASQGLRVLDIGAGYGRLAHRLCSSGLNIADYCCCDAIPMSSFLCEYYLEYRGIAPPARVTLLDEVQTLQPGAFDLAVNIHSFSECNYAAIGWWVGQLQRLQVPWLLLIPNEGEQLLSTETGDGRVRRDFSDLLQQAGYRRHAMEAVVADEAARQLIGNPDQMLLFRREPN